MTATVDAATGCQPSDLPLSMAARITLIIDVFDFPGCTLRLEDVTRRTDLPRSTVRRILHQLTDLDWIEATPRGFRLGSRFVGEASPTDGDRLRVVAAPHLHELHLRTGAVVHLAVLKADRVFYLDKIGGAFARKVPSRVGGSQPAHGTALGKAILARLDPMEVDELARPQGSEPGLRGDLGSLQTELYRVRSQRGLAFERGTMFAGIGCAGMAVVIDQHPVAAISAAVPAEGPLERLGPAVAEAARAMARDLVGKRSARPRFLRGA